VPVLTIDMDASGTVHLPGVAGRRPYGHVPPTDPALILHTSGSTGRPKRVPLSHANLSISASNVAKTYALGPGDVSLCVMPLFHVHGLVASTLATLATGGTVVVPAKFSPLSFWRVARDHGATWYSAVPTIHQLLLARAEGGAARPAGAEKLRFTKERVRESLRHVSSGRSRWPNAAAHGGPTIDAVRRLLLYAFALPYDGGAPT
jgi:acyl-CoA synthetase (AMP-forming)/AMP-acid ligase II